MFLLGFFLGLGGSDWALRALEMDNESMGLVMGFIYLFCPSKTYMIVPHPL